MWKGFTREEKSASAVRISAPAGSEAAMSPPYSATEAPVATRSTGTPASRAKEARTASASSYRGPSGVPSARIRTARFRAVTVRAGSRPLLAVLR